MFGKDPRDDEILYLRQENRRLVDLLATIAEPAALARLVPRPERKEPTGQPRRHWKTLEDRPEASQLEATQEGARRAVDVRESFKDTRQP